MRGVRIVLLLWVVLWLSGAEAHSGRTDKHGCHVDRKTGIRHCH